MSAEQTDGRVNRILQIGHPVLNDATLKNSTLAAALARNPPTHAGPNVVDPAHEESVIVWLEIDGEQVHGVVKVMDKGMATLIEAGIPAGHGSAMWLHAGAQQHGVPTSATTTPVLFTRTPAAET